MAAAAAEGAKLTEQVGLSCPEFGRSMTPPKFEPPMKRSSIVAHVRHLFFDTDKNKPPQLAYGMKSYS